ncbi:MAG: SAM-dependent methyltransferase, partial [Coriobacteriia bacterium]|nr:SAM-dependent methyltransferase [Coriobacteriia bacterium]
YDPACGIAEVLFLVAQADKTGQRKVIGNEINEYALRTAKQRFFLAGMQGDFICTDSIIPEDKRPGLKADVVVLETPYERLDFSPDLFDRRWRFAQPTRRDPEIAWIQEALAHLSDDGKAFVVTSSRALSSAATSISRLRMSLINQGCIESIISLPKTMTPLTSGRHFIWVLRRPAESSQHVLFIDASGELEDRVSTGIDLPEYLKPLRKASDLLYAAQVSFFDISDQSYNLEPSNWIPKADADKGQLALDYSVNHKSFNDALSGIQRIKVVQPLSEDFSSQTTFSIRQLIDGGIVRLRTGQAIAQNEADAGQTQTVTVQDLAQTTDYYYLNLTAKHQTGKDSDSKAGAVGNTESKHQSLPGDILMTTTDQLQAVIDRQGGNSVARPIRILTILDQSKLSAEYMLECLRDSYKKASRSLPGTQRIKLVDIEIPWIDRKAQLKVVEELKAIRAIQQAAKAISVSADDHISSLIDVIRHGVNCT